MNRSRLLAIWTFLDDLGLPQRSNTAGNDNPQRGMIAEYGFFSPKYF